MATSSTFAAALARARLPSPLVLRYRGSSGMAGAVLAALDDLDRVPAQRASIVPTELLRRAYIRYEASRSPSAIKYVPLEHGLELGIVASGVPAIARAISSMLRRSLDDARDDRGGHLPSPVVDRVQRDVISPHGVAKLWGATGHRFVLSRALDGRQSELLATILIGQSKDTLFFFTGRYNNLRHSTIAEDVDFAQADEHDPRQRWFARFAFPALIRFKPRAYHQIANFVVSRERRGQGLARRLLDAIVAHYARDVIDRRGGGVGHSQHLLCGRGLWQIGDRPTSNTTSPSACRGATSRSLPRRRPASTSWTASGLNHGRPARRAGFDGGCPGGQVIGRLFDGQGWPSNRRFLASFTARPPPRRSAALRVGRGLLRGPGVAAAAPGVRESPVLARGQRSRGPLLARRGGGVLGYSRPPCRARTASVSSSSPLRLAAAPRRRPASPAVKRP